MRGKLFMLLITAECPNFLFGGVKLTSTDYALIQQHHLDKTIMYIIK